MTIHRLFARSINWSSPRTDLRLLAGVVLFLAALIAPTRAADAPARGSVQVEALQRLKGIDLDANPAVKAAVLRALQSLRGTETFVELVRDFGVREEDEALLDYTLAHPRGSAGVEAMRILLGREDPALVRRALAGTNALPAVTALAGVKQKEAAALLEPLLNDSRREPALRRAAVQALAQVREGAARILQLAREDKLPADLKLAASSELNAVRWDDLRAEAADLLPPPQARGAEPLPPVSELVKRLGDAQRGAEIYFRGDAACASCHQVHGKGTDFGPDLSEIGSKFGKEALYDAILEPSAGISFGFEAWQIHFKNGDEAFGLIVSETDNEIALKTPDGILSRYPKAQIDSREKRSTSIMPEGLQAALTAQELVDLVEFLASLKTVAR